VEEIGESMATDRADKNVRICLGSQRDKAPSPA
jgi:hypothetical protein